MIKSIADYMLKHDKVAVWLGVEIVEVSKGYALIKMKVKDYMLNAVNICLGGAIFSFADFAFALASNSHGKVAVALSSNISFPSPALSGDTLFAEAVEVALGNRIGLYEVKVFKEDKTTVALFTGQVYRKDKSLKELFKIGK